MRVTFTPGPGLGPVRKSGRMVVVMVVGVGDIVVVVDMEFKLQGRCFMGVVSDEAPSSGLVYHDAGLFDL